MIDLSVLYGVGDGMVPTSPNPHMSLVAYRPAPLWWVLCSPVFDFFQLTTFLQSRLPQILLPWLLI